ncbi:MAG: hypothetical protein WD988_01140 [Candidatus Curtissbacteria bacterium]
MNTFFNRKFKKLNKLSFYRRRRSIFRRYIKHGRIFGILGGWALNRLTAADFRLVWYSLLLWVVCAAVGSAIVLPLFYLITAISIFVLTVAFFRKIKRFSRRDKIFARGLRTSLFWSVVVLVMDLVTFVGFDLASLLVYFSDPRSWFKYPLIIFLPIIYSLVLENLRDKRLENDGFVKVTTRAGIGA